MVEDCLVDMEGVGGEEEGGEGVVELCERGTRLASSIKLN